MVREAEKTFNDYLESKDLKYTSQRKTILHEALKVKGHFSAEELLDTTKKQDKSISKATLYRTLTLLTESKILEEHDFGSGHKSYESMLGHHHHDHMICVKCRRIIEFENTDIERIQDEEAKKNKFKVIFHSHKLFGLCKACQ
jgi:Fur family ferric uptake transcriptional regulator